MLIFLLRIISKSSYEARCVIVCDDVKRIENYVTKSSVVACDDVTKIDVYVTN